MSDTPQNQITTYQPPQQQLTAFSSQHNFEQAQRMAQALASSALVPESYQGSVANCLVALEVAQRCQASPLMVMQNLHMIQGRPSWSAPYIIAAINSSGRFEPLRFEMKDLGPKTVEYTYWEGPKGARVKKNGKVSIVDKSCIAWSKDRTGERLESPAITVEIAVKEGWYMRNDSKWQTMPDLMLRYRAASFFGRLYASEILMGMRSEDEEHDIIDITPGAPTVAAQAETIRQEINEKIKRGRPKKESAPVVEPVAEVVETAAATGEEGFTL